MASRLSFIRSPSPNQPPRDAGTLELAVCSECEGPCGLPRPNVTTGVPSHLQPCLFLCHPQVLLCIQCNPPAFASRVLGIRACVTLTCLVCFFRSCFDSGPLPDKQELTLGSEGTG